MKAKGKKVEKNVGKGGGGGRNREKEETYRQSTFLSLFVHIRPRRLRTMKSIFFCLCYSTDGLCFRASPSPFFVRMIPFSQHARERDVAMRMQHMHMHSLAER